MSSERNIIKVYFKGTHLVYSKTQYQYNHGMILHFADLNLPQAFEAHFANKQHGISKTVIGSENKVEIPDEYFWTGANEIYAWVYLHSNVDDGETVYEVRIPLVKRAKPTDEEPLPEQESTINRAIAELNHAVEQTSADAEQTSADREAVTALRDEVIALKHDDIDPVHMVISVHATESRRKDENGIIRTFIQESTKTESGFRLVVVPKQFQYLLTRLYERSKDTEYVFEYKGKRIHSNAIRKKLARICGHVGVPYKSPHKIRKTYCSILFDNQLSSSFIINQMGYTSISTSEIFYHKNRTPVGEKVELVLQIEEFANV